MTFGSFALMGGAYAYQVGNVADGGSIRGAVKFDGALPPTKKLPINKDNEVCGQGPFEVKEVDVGVGGALKGVVVYLEKVEKGKAWPSATYMLDQKKCAFAPVLQVVRNGANLTIRNSDPVLHNVHPYEIVGKSRRTLFNLAQPNQGQTNSMKIDAKRGRAIELSCDAHNWMSGWVYVVDNPYYAVVGVDGKFEIGNVPAGEYKITAWHPALGALSLTARVVAKGAADAVFTFKAGS